jgi:hypothetical protein
MVVEVAEYEMAFVERIKDVGLCACELCPIPRRATAITCCGEEANYVLA